MRIKERVNKETISTTWDTDWYDLQHSQLLYHTLDFIRHDESMLKIWGGNYNSYYF